MLKEMTGMMAQLVGALATVDNNRATAAVLLFCSGFAAGITARHLGSSSMPMHGEHLANNEKRSVAKVACRLYTADCHRLCDMVSNISHNRLSLLELGLIGAVWVKSDLDCWKWADVVKNVLHVKDGGSLVMEASKCVCVGVYSIQCIKAYQEELLPLCWNTFLEMVKLFNGGVIVWRGVGRTYDGACAFELVSIVHLSSSHFFDMFDQIMKSEA